MASTTFSVEEYPNKQNLWFIIAKERLERAFPRKDLSILVSDKPLPPDRNGYAQVEITFTLQGSAAAAAAKMLDDCDLVEHTFQPTYRIRSEMLETLPTMVGVVACRTRNGLIVSCLRFPGEPLKGEKDWIALGRRMEEILTAQTHQTFHHDPSEAAFAGGRGGGGRGSARGGASWSGGRGGSFTSGPRQVVAERTNGGARGSGFGRGGRGRGRDGDCSVDPKRDPLFAGFPDVDDFLSMDYRMAQERLSAGFLAAFGGENNASSSGWLHFMRYLLEVEKRFAVSVLAAYEIRATILNWSGSVRQIADIRLDLSNGAQPFTERRPSVRPGDSVKLRDTRDSEHILTFPVFLVLPFKVGVHITGKDAEHFDITRAYDCIFDPAPFVGRCEKLQRGAAAGAIALDFLRLGDPAYSPDIASKARDSRGRTMEEVMRIEGRTAQANGTNGTAEGNGADGGAASGEGEGRTVKRVERGRSRGPAHGAQEGSNGRGRGGEGVRNGAHNGAPPTAEDLLLATLDDVQKRAAWLILRPPEGMQKFFLDGPPGTGKTETMCRCIAALLRTNPSARILVVSTSHSAMDVATLRTAAVLGFPDRNERTLLRLYTPFRHPLMVPPQIFPYTNFEPMKEYKDMRNSDRFDVGLVDDKNWFTHRAVFTTMTATGQFREAGFTHLFVDEVAQAPLVETILALNAVPRRQLLVVCGDDRQREPQSLCPNTRRWLKLHAVSAEFARSTCPRVTLSASHRASPALTELQSALFYNKRLQSAATARNREEPLKGWSGFRGSEEEHPVRFIHVQDGETDEGVSFINKKEEDVILNIAMSLRGEKGIEPRRVLVFSQYAEQRRLLRNRLQMHGLRETPVKELDEVVGDEVDVVIISLTRSEKDDGLLDSKSLNSAMSRSRHLCIFVGDGRFLLKLDTRGRAGSKWPELISYLNTKNAVEGFNAETGDFGPHEYRRLDTSAGLVIKEFIPQSRGGGGGGGAKKPSQHFQRLSDTEVLAEPERYLVGYVHVHATWEAGVFVRNSGVCGADVFVEQDCVTGERRDWVFPGDLVAVELQEKARWKDLEGGAIGRTEPLPLSAPTNSATRAAGISCPLRPFLVDDFPCCPEKLEDTAGLAKRPVGVVVAVLEQAAVPLVVGRIVGSNFEPLTRALPSLRIRVPTSAASERDVFFPSVNDAQMKLNFWVARLHRPDELAPQFEILEAESRSLLHDVAQAGGTQAPPRFHPLLPRALPTGAVSRPPKFAEEPGTSVWSLPGKFGGFNLSRSDNAHHSVNRVQVYIPTAMWTLAAAPELEMTYCASPFLPISAETFFTSTEDENAGTTQFDAVCVSFDITTEIKTGFATVNALPEVSFCSAVAFPLADDPGSKSDLALCHASLQSARKRCADMGSTCLESKSIDQELFFWANHAAALFLWNTTPTFAMLYRQAAIPSAGRDLVGEEGIVNGDVRFLSPEIWLPLTEEHAGQNQRSGHASTGFPLYTDMCSQTFAATLVQRLVYAASRIATKGTTALDLSERNLMEQIRRHVGRLNTILTAYSK